MRRASAGAVKDGPCPAQGRASGTARRRALAGAVALVAVHAACAVRLPASGAAPAAAPTRAADAGGTDTPAMGELPAIAARCTVRAHATSTLHDFDATAPCARFDVDSVDGAYRARVEIGVADLDTAHAERDERMRAMFEADRHPRIVAVFDRIVPADVRARRAGALDFRLTMHGVERPVSPVITAWREDERRATLRAGFDVSLRDFGMKPPVTMLFLRVGDRVRIEVEVELGPAPG